MFPRSPFRTSRAFRALGALRARPVPLALPVLGVGVALGASLSACGGTDEVTMPPLTPEPGDAHPAATAAAAAPAARTKAARVVLYKYLRGVASGDVKVCASLSPAYERATFGRPGGCRTGLAQVRSRLRAEDVTALRGVTVPAAEAGPGDGEVTVRFEDLRWKTAPARPGGVIAARYTLQLTGARWLIIG
ncbi:hypothetical protein [Actinomadura rugatobispora]|uniref:Nuclear transport factor 2 family protein n=1 Tax=Actinomadura rugatobispora TaxID=1994 RepID=A0ABW1AEK6_9ACTN|nr:hypothetical protein GCM10010200_058020 [Actinomadura rugatobispora]